MKSDNPRDTIGKIAKEYGYDTRVFWTIIEPFKELHTDLTNYLANAKKKGKGKKILPPLLVDKIFKTLGEP